MKWDFKTIVALLAVGLFVFEIVAIGVLGGGTLPFFEKQEQQVLGQVEFNGSIRTYDPFLVIPGGIDSSLMTDLKSLDGVKEITAEQGDTVILLETRDDVYSTALYLKTLNITSYTLANIAPPGFVPVLLETGETVNATFSVPIKVETTPLVPPDTMVSVAIVVLVSENAIVNYGSAYILTEEKTVSLTGKVENEMFAYVYSIPWEERNNITPDDFEAYGEVYYQKENMGFFDRELTSDEMLAAKQLDYIEYIDKRSAVFSDDFTDSEEAISDLDAGISFLPSMLAIISNETLNITYDSSQSYLYTIRINPGEYTIDENMQVITIESPDEVSASTVPLSLKGKFIGPILFEIESVSISREQQ